ncbi:MAG: hypothetical protein WCS77_06395 [Elusimicrobiaceae bacterium]|jgi:hypothetical protein
MTKDEFIVALGKLINTEEKLVDIYMHHIQTVMQWSGLGEREKDAVHKIISELMTDSKSHLQRFTLILERVKKGEIDVY